MAERAGIEARIVGDLRSRGCGVRAARLAVAHGIRVDDMEWYLNRLARLGLATQRRGYWKAA